MLDDSQFTDMYGRHSAGLERYITRIVGDVHAALDITHDTLVKALERSPTLDYDGAPIAPWLYRVAHNAALDHVRRVRHSTPEEPAAIARRCERNEAARLEWGQTDALHAAISVLPPAQRHVTILRYRDGLTPTEIGLVLGKSAAAIRQLELRALRGLRTTLAAHDELEARERIYSRTR